MGDAARDVARETLQHHRCITAARPALSSALLPLLQSLQFAQQHQHQNSEAPSAATGRAAALIVAARPHATTAQAQVHHCCSMDGILFAVLVSMAYVIVSNLVLKSCLLSCLSLWHIAMSSFMCRL